MPLFVLLGTFILDFRTFRFIAPKNIELSPKDPIFVVFFFFLRVQKSLEAQLIHYFRLLFQLIQNVYDYGNINNY